MYFDEPKDKAAIKSTPEMRWALSLNALALLGLGLMPQSLMNLCAYAITLSLS
jgi:NADH-quinone oxidoreductase subunit N